jgi:hypothetical protein
MVLMAYVPTVDTDKYDPDGEYLESNMASAYDDKYIRKSTTAGAAKGAATAAGAVATGMGLLNVPAAALGGISATTGMGGGLMGVSLAMGPVGWAALGTVAAGATIAALAAKKKAKKQRDLAAEADSDAEAAARAKEIAGSKAAYDAEQARVAQSSASSLNASRSSPQGAAGSDDDIMSAGMNSSGGSTFDAWKRGTYGG